jgi:hypothetical protein
MAGVEFGLEVGLGVAVIGASRRGMSPYVEWWTDMLPTQRLGAFGAVLVGFALRLLQYWTTLLNLDVR